MFYLTFIIWTDSEETKENERRKRDENVIYVFGGLGEGGCIEDRYKEAHMEDASHVTQNKQ